MSWGQTTVSAHGTAITSERFREDEESQLGDDAYYSDPPESQTDHSVNNSQTSHIVSAEKCV